MLKTTGLRWCSERPVGPQKCVIISEGLSIGHAMDLFIDHWLYFLPLPRFCRPFDIDEPSQESILRALDWPQAKTLQDASTAFVRFWPHLSSLRDAKASLENQALLLCLMALDPVALRLLDIKIMYKPGFKESAHKAIFEDLRGSEPEPTTQTGAVDILQKVHSFLFARRLSGAIEANNAEDSWTSWALAQDRGLTNTEIDARAQEFLTKVCAKHFLGPETIGPLVHLKNFIDEVPEFGLKIND